MGASVLAGYADARLARALTAMHAHPERDWTLEALADAAGMSEAAWLESLSEHLPSLVGRLSPSGTLRPAGAGGTSTTL